MCAELEAEAPQPRSKLLYPRPGESTKDNKCPHCDKDLKGKIHDLHTCLRETLAAKHWAAYSVLVGTGIVCPGATCKVFTRRPRRSRNTSAPTRRCLEPRRPLVHDRPGRQCGATFSSRAHAISHLEEAHGFVAKKAYVQVTLEYVFHCDLDHRWFLGGNGTPTTPERMGLLAPSFLSAVPPSRVAKILPSTCSAPSVLETRG